MEVLSQAKAKQIRLLQQKKIRQQEGLFVVEGAKSVLETLASNWKVEWAVGTSRFFQLNEKELEHKSLTWFETDEKTLSQISYFETNETCLALVKQKQPLQKPDENATLWLALDGISDPGNLGSIIRLADWFGLNEIICHGPVVEWYNPKVIAGSMGSFLRVQPIISTEKNIEILWKNRTLLVATMEGDSVFGFPIPKNTCLVIGNESHGISASLLANAHRKISIPRFGAAESLNAAMATAILLSHWRST